MNIEYLKKAKKEKKITFEKLSELSGVPISTIYDLFRGVTNAPRIDTIQALEKALDIKNSPNEWTEADQTQGVGKYPTYLSSDEVEWIELRSEILRIHGEEYLNTLIATLKALTKK